MKILITGASGMLGKIMYKTAKFRGFDVAGVDLSGSDFDVDLTNDDELAWVFNEVQPEVVINCAAVIDVTYCEKNPLLAWRVNARLVERFVNCCREFGAGLVQISTDHYYFGDGQAKHSEDADVCFLNEYARSKFAGEAFALSYDKGIVLRTNIIGFRGSSRPTFAEWIFNVVEQDLEVTLFMDAFVSCIDTGSFSKALFDLIDCNQTRGLINLASREVFSKGKLLKRVADHLHIKLTRAVEGSVCELKVIRPNSCGLDVAKAEKLLGYSLPDLDHVILNLIEMRNGANKSK